MAERAARAGALAMLPLLAACVGGTPGADDSGGPAPEPVALPEDCSPLPAAAGAAVVDSVDSLVAALDEAGRGGVVALADGTYNLSDGDGITVPAGVTLRSQSGDPGAVVLEGGFATAELVTLSAGATLAEVTLAHAYADALAIHGQSNARVYGVRVEDAGGRGVAILPERGVYADAATVGCVTVTRTTECDVGVEGVQTEGSRVYGSVVEQPGCDAPGIAFATGSRATVVERSRVRTGGGIAVRFGSRDYAADEPRIYADAPCADEAMGHYGGALRNLFVVGGDIRVESTCGARVEHLSAWGGSLSWGFSTDLSVAWTLAALLPGGDATTAGTLAPTEADFVDAAAGDLHLAEGSAAIDGAAGSSVAEDIDGDTRDGVPDIGADER